MSNQRLTAFDEFPRHQTTGTFNSVASDSPYWSDGFYFTLGDQETGASLFVGMRLYSNTDVMDGFACVTVDGKQYIAVQSGWGVDAQRKQDFLDKAFGTKTNVPQGGVLWVFGLPETTR